MANACALPVAVAGALMPDAHVGYGLPIGGVLATENAVIPYAVGVDIACRMRLSVFDCKAQTIAGQKDRLANIIARTGCFDPDEVRRLTRDPRLQASDVVEIVANSALAVLDNYLIQGLAPARTAAA